MTKIAIIIVSWNVEKYLHDCLNSVFEEIVRSGLSAEVWVVDNGSMDGTVGMVEADFPQVHLILNQGNPGFGAANNQGMVAARQQNEPQFYFLLNPDTIMKPHSLQRLVDALDDKPDVGMVGARLAYGNGRFQHSAFYFPGLMQLAFDLFPMPARLYESRWNGRYPRASYEPTSNPFPIDHPLGATMMVRADVAHQTNGFDEQFQLYCEEIDWCWRIHEAGWKIYAVPAAEVVHFGGESSSQVPIKSLINLWRSRAQLYKAHYPRWRVLFAKWLVIVGMKRKRRQTDDPKMQAAYQTILQIWQEI